MRLKDKVALVTGGASGFGAEITRVFAREGASVAVVDINEAGAAEVARGINGPALPIRCDVTRRADIEAAVKAIQWYQSIPTIRYWDKAPDHVRDRYRDVARAALTAAGCAADDEPRIVDEICSGTAADRGPDGSPPSSRASRRVAQRARGHRAAR